MVWAQVPRDATSALPFVCNSRTATMLTFDRDPPVCRSNVHLPLGRCLFCITGIAEKMRKCMLHDAFRWASKWSGQTAELLLAIALRPLDPHVVRVSGTSQLELMPHFEVLTLDFIEPVYVAYHGDLQLARSGVVKDNRGVDAWQL